MNDMKVDLQLPHPSNVHADITHGRRLLVVGDGEAFFQTRNTFEWKTKRALYKWVVLESMLRIFLLSDSHISL